MKTIFLAMILVFTQAAFGRAIRYKCISQSGKITILDKGSAVEIDLQEHDFYSKKNAWGAFTNIVSNPEENYKDFVLKISEELYTGSVNSKFVNSDSKLIVRAVSEFNMDTCRADIHLYKKSHELSLKYSCSTLKKVNFEFKDELTCLL